jgi:hypothetical protein
MELFELPNESPMAYRSGGVTVTPLSSSALIVAGILFLPSPWN